MRQNISTDWLISDVKRMFVNCEIVIYSFEQSADLDNKGCKRFIMFGHAISHGNVDLIIFASFWSRYGHHDHLIVLGDRWISIYIYIYIYTRAYTFVRMYMYVYVCTYVCMYVCMGMFTCLYVYMYACMSVCMYVYVCVCMYACISVWMYVCRHVCTYMCGCS